MSGMLVSWYLLVSLVALAAYLVSPPPDHEFRSPQDCRELWCRPTRLTSYRAGQLVPYHRLPIGGLSWGVKV